MVVWNNVSLFEEKNSDIFNSEAFCRYFINFSALLALVMSSEMPAFRRGVGVFALYLPHFRLPSHHPASLSSLFILGITKHFCKMLN